jgi:tRNA(fMet)-specific endonuclease VapC
MKLALDTNAYSAAARGEPRSVALMQAAHQLYLPFVVLAELRAGFAAGTAGRRNEALLARFLGSPRASVLYADEQTTHHYANVFAQLRRQGTPIPTNDIWIAAIVLQHDLALLTSDAHFSSLPQIARA